MAKKKKKNNPKYEKALVEYIKLKLNDEKNVEQKIADIFGVKEKTVRNWKSKYKWDEKYWEKQKEANLKALEQLARDIEKQDIRMIDKAIDNLKMAEMNVMGTLDGAYSPKDYETMVKIYLLLTGKATERVETDNKTSHSLSEKDKETLAKFSQNIVADIEGAEIGIKEEGEEGEKIE